MVLLFQDIIFKYNQSNILRTWGESCALHYFLINLLLLLILQTKAEFAYQAKDQQQPVQPVIITSMPRQISGNSIGASWFSLNIYWFPVMLLSKIIIFKIGDVILFETPQLDVEGPLTNKQNESVQIVRTVNSFLLIHAIGLLF